MIVTCPYLVEWQTAGYTKMRKYRGSEFFLMWCLSLECLPSKSNFPERQMFTLQNLGIQFWNDILSNLENALTFSRNFEVASEKFLQNFYDQIINDAKIINLLVDFIKVKE